MKKRQKPQQQKSDDLTRKMSQWQVENPNATLTEIEEAVEVELAKLRKQLVETMVSEKEADQQTVPNCPQCGEPMVKNGQRKRKLTSKEGQTLVMNRQQWRCLNCGATLFPPG